MAKSSFKTLLRDTIEAVRDSKVPIRAVDYDPRTKHLRVEFADAAPAPVAPPVSLVPAAPVVPLAERIKEAETKYVPGTRIPDDDSPIDAMELASARPVYAMNGSG